MDRDFISLFQQNNEYREKRSPLNLQIEDLESQKKAAIAHYDAQIEAIMHEIAKLEQPACNHDICLHVKTTDYYINEGYACIICGSLLMSEDPSSQIIEITEEMELTQISSLLSELRQLIAKLLSNNANISIEELVDNMKLYLQENRGAGR